MIYGSLQTEFLGLKHNGNIDKYGTPIFDDIVVYVPEPTDNDNQIFWRL